MAVIMPPSECPSCKSPLVFVNHILYCKNTACGEKLQKKLENFAQKVKIKGLGPSTIKKLDIQYVEDLYYLEKEEVVEKLGEKLGTKLFEEIKKSHDAPANLLLPAFSIPLVGATATAKLATVCNDIWDIDTDSCTKAGLGPKTAQELLDWKDENIFFLAALPHSMKFEKTNKTSNQEVVCITGKLSSYKTKAEATTLLNELGYEVKSTVTKDVTILVNESGIESAKVKKARASGVTIITNLSDITGDQYGDTSKVDR